uniref:Uncharacterized protein n=1 Tax=Panagrolaimus sp. PS1159 TaxID=55785 RepID=A0AC35EY92_9BILA
MSRQKNSRKFHDRQGTAFFYFISLCICILLAEPTEDSDKIVEASGQDITTTEKEESTAKPVPTEPTAAPIGMFFGMILMFLLTQLYQWWYKRRVNNAEFRIY